MDETEGIKRLTRLLGSARLERERAEGKALPKSKNTADLDEYSGANTSSGTKKMPSDTKVSLESETSVASYDNASGSVLDLKKLKQGDKASDKVSRDVKSAESRRFKSPWSDSENSDLEDSAFEKDQQAAPGEVFCPIQAASKYPYTYLNHKKAFMESVASASFNAGQFWEHKFNMSVCSFQVYALHSHRSIFANIVRFYLLCPEDISSSPLLLIPLNEFKAVLAHAETRLNTKLEITNSARKAGFCLSFGEQEPRPRFLGLSRCRADYDGMKDQVMDQNEPKPPGSMSLGDLRAWEIKIKAAIQTCKGKKSKKGKSQKKNAEGSEEWHQRLLRAQAYLGMNTYGADERAKMKMPIFDGLGPDLNHQPTFISQTSSTFDISSPPPYKFLNDTVFVAIDVEANEHVHNQITEIGVSTLDTRSLKDIAPGRAGENWRGLIKYRHFRIEEYKYHRNKDFIQGCPDRFEKAFGQSEFIRKADVPKAMAMCCKPPFHHKVAEQLSVDDASNDETAIEEKEYRNVVFVGHNFGADVSYLKSAGFDVLGLSGFLEVVDTDIIHRAVTRGKMAASLVGILEKCGIDAWNLHNAGNDAGYTLQALLALAVAHAANPGGGGKLVKGEIKVEENEADAKAEADA